MLVDKNPILTCDYFLFLLQYFFCDFCFVVQPFFILWEGEASTKWHIFTLGSCPVQQSLFCWTLRRSTGASGVKGLAQGQGLVAAVRGKWEQVQLNHFLHQLTSSLLRPLGHLQNDALHFTPWMHPLLLFCSKMLKTILGKMFKKSKKWYSALFWFRHGSFFSISAIKFYTSFYSSLHCHKCRRVGLCPQSFNYFFYFWLSVDECWCSAFTKVKLTESNWMPEPNVESA